VSKNETQPDDDTHTTPGKLGTTPGQPDAGPDGGPDGDPGPGPGPGPGPTNGPRAVPVGGFLRYGAAGAQILGSRKARTVPATRVTRIVHPPRPARVDMSGPNPFLRPRTPEPAPPVEEAPAAPKEAPPPVPAAAVEPPRPKAPRRKPGPVPLQAPAPITSAALAMLALGGGDPIPNPADVERATPRNASTDADAPPGLSRTITLKVSEEDYALITAFGAAMYPVARPHVVVRGWIVAQIGAIRAAQARNLPPRSPQRGPW